MKTAIIGIFLVLVSSCATPSSTPLIQHVVLSNKGSVSVFYDVIGLETSYLIDINPRISFEAHQLPELKAGAEISLQPIEVYEKQNGIAVLVYKAASIDGTTVLQIAEIRQVPYQDLKALKSVDLQ